MHARSPEAVKKKNENHAVESQKNTKITRRAWPGPARSRSVESQKTKRLVFGFAASAGRACRRRRCRRAVLHRCGGCATCRHRHRRHPCSKDFQHVRAWHAPLRWKGCQQFYCSSSKGGGHHYIWRWQSVQVPCPLIQNVLMDGWMDVWMDWSVQMLGRWCACMLLFIRSFCYVDDLVDGLVWHATSPSTPADFIVTII